jgi:hypothetical protein
VRVIAVSASTSTHCSVRGMPGEWFLGYSFIQCVLAFMEMSAHQQNIFAVFRLLCPRKKYRNLKLPPGNGFS